GSPALEFRRHEQQRQRLQLALGPRHRLLRVGRYLGLKGTLDNLSRVDAAADALGVDARDVETPAYAVDPGCLVIGIAARRWRAPERLAQGGLAAREPGR